MPGSEFSRERKLTESMESPTSANVTSPLPVTSGSTSYSTQVWVPGHAGAGGGVDADQRAAEPQWIAAGIRGGAELAVVPDSPAGAVTAGHVQVAVRPELDPASGVEGELLAPVLDQHLLGAVHPLAVHPAGARRGPTPRS